MQSDGDGVGANRTPFPRGSAAAEVLDVDRVLQHQTGAVRNRALLDDAFQNWRGPIGTEDVIGGEKAARLFHRLPAGDLGKKSFTQFHCAHSFGVNLPYPSIRPKHKNTT